MSGPQDLRAVVTGASSGIGAAYAHALGAASAGLGHTARFDTQSPEAIRAMIDVNVRALVETTHAFLPGMRARGRGRLYRPRGGGKS